ncbi:YolD-like family protein [Bacillus sp. FDAARGOS_235]|nr:YolD-like family protein [Bacillus sp. FDAARGOS_235]
MYERQNKVLMPILDEQKLDFINNILYCAIAENKRVCISYQIQSMFRMGNYDSMSEK